MATEIREFCDCCHAEFDMDEDGTTVYRRRIRRFHKPWWPRFSTPEVSWEVVCEDCWRAIGREVERARAALGDGEQR